MSEDHKKVLKQQLWNIADTLRGKMNADEFRDYILGFIFYKYLSEKMEIFANEILKQDKVKFREINQAIPDFDAYIKAIKEEALEQLGYFLKPEELFTEVAVRGKGENNENDHFDEEKTGFILEDVQKILLNIQSSTMGTDSEEDFDNLFEDMDLNSTKLGKTPEARNTIIAKVLTHLDKIDFKLEHTELDVLGDAYEYLIGQFASNAGKKAGEFYTPQEVSMILAKIVTTGKQKLKSVYDPTCGSGSLLLRVAKEVDDVGDFYGQEMNRTTYNLARMNMILHGVHYREFDIKQEDTLERPQHIDMEFEAIVANPPFSAKWSANPLFTSDDRFSQYGKLAPSSKADFAFVQHMIHHLAENGTMGIILPHGVLFRSSAEQHIRRYLIENKNYLDAVIGLPANIFYGTSIPTCILIFKKCRESPDDVLFIDASNEFQKEKRKNAIKEVHINKIVDTYQNRIEHNKFSHRASMKEIIDNDYNLNIKRYVDTFEAEEEIDIIDTVKLLKKYQLKLVQNDSKLKHFCKELQVPFPDGINAFLLKKFKHGIIQKLFKKELRFKDSKGNYFPEWEEKHGNDVFKSISNKNHDSDLPILAITQEYGAVPRELIDFNISVSNKSVDGYKVVEIGDFIISLRSFQGGIEYSYYHGICSPAYIILKPKIELEDQYFKHYFKTNAYIQLLNKKLEGIRDGKMISYKYFSEIKLPIPSIPEQVKIASFLSVLDRKIQLIEGDLDKQLLGS